jgi:protein involved in polysaccharide export with SLBB domain
MHLLGGTTKSVKRSHGAFALMAGAVCCAFLSIVLSGCSTLGGSSGGSGNEGTSLNDFINTTINNTVPLPAGANTASATPAQRPNPENPEDNIDVGMDPTIDNSFTPNGEPILRTGYVLRVAVAVGDKLEVNPLEVQISEKNEITLPFIGKVDCDGLTINGLRSRLVTRYEEFFRKPDVTISFVIHDAYSSPWGRVYVQGRVNREGWVSIPATRCLMLSDAIQAAGGFAQFAKRSNIRVSRRMKDGSIKRFKIDLEEIGRQGRTENDMRLQSGDVVYVFESSI